jgi:imidazolonepropionase-like amidohydrolase
MTRFPITRALLAFTLLASAGEALAQAQTPRVSDTVTVGRYDLGRMWTFENPPIAEFAQHGFAPDSAWFRHLHMAALRVPGCSASFVSADGLIVTNHHCARGSITAVNRPGETLLDSGFVARTIAEERRIPNYFADQLVAVEDISAEMNAAIDAASTAADREAARRRVASEAQVRLRQRFAASADSVVVQIVPLYSGGRTSAYVFRRYTDIRLVAAPELLMGFFGGDWDNFTYPRYSLDFAVMRAWDASGSPVRTDHYFRWGSDGVRDGEPIFIVGNPGQTSRLTTASQLAYQRDLVAPVQLAFLDSRLEAMEAYRQAHPAEAEAYGIRNRMFSLSNTRKSLRGRHEALRDPAVMGRREAIERMLIDSIGARPAMQSRYGHLFRDLAAIQEQRMSHVMPYTAFNWLFQPTAGSVTLQRAFWAWRASTRPDSAAVFTERMLRVPDVPRDLEMRYLALQLDDIAVAHGPESPVTRAVLSGRTAPGAAERLLTQSALRDTAGLRRAASGALASDPLMQAMAVIGPRILALQDEMAALAAREAELAAQVGRARYEIYGSSIPPDGSSSLRVADGVVRGYEYNGTWAPPFTTFHGLYDRFRVMGPGTDWDLPHRWRTPPPGLDLGTPLNFVSTADTYGGNSGSPVVTRDLRIVGLNFDRNVNALVRDYLYLPERGRNVMVDVRAIEQSLSRVYGAEHVVNELRSGRRTASDAPASGAPASGTTTASPVVAFTGVNVIPMDGSPRVLRNHTVLVSGGRITGLGPTAATAIPAGATRIEGEGRYLIPGLAEMHAHIPGPQAPAQWMEQLMFLYVANGVTTIRGMLGAPNQLEIRDRIERGELLGPTFYVGAPSLNGNSAPDPATAERLVREHAGAGYDFLKLHPGLSRPVYDAIVRAGRQVGITWAGHVSAAVGLEHTIATRQSTVDHLDGLLEAAAADSVRDRVPAGGVPLGTLMRSIDPLRLRALAVAMRDSMVWSVPTAYLWENFASSRPVEELTNKPEFRYVPAQMREGWAQQKRNMIQGAMNAGRSDADNQLWIQRRREALKALADAGAPLLMGSDAPQMFNVPGFSVLHETRTMAAAGLTPYQILESGTRNVARYVAGDLRKDARFGTVAPGNFADLVLLTANPLDDIGNLSRRAGVMVRGRWFPEDEIRRRLDEIAASHAP